MCDYGSICETYFKDLNLPAVYFDPEWNMCYCSSCHTERGDKTSYNRGVPPKRYVIPVGWFRFALKIPGNMQARDVASLWHRAYHGTQHKAIKSIIEVGKIVPTGRTVVGGHHLHEREGHIKDSKETRAAGHFTKMTFLTPSIEYAGRQVYAAADRVEINGRTYKSRIVFQVFVKPGSYQVKPHTLGAQSRQIDPVHPNSELHWVTDLEGGHVLNGLLVKLTPVEETFL